MSQLKKFQNEKVNKCFKLGELVLKFLLKEIPIPTETSGFGADVGGASVGIVVGELVEGSSVCGEVVADVGAGVGLGGVQSIPAQQ